MMEVSFKLINKDICYLFRKKQKRPKSQKKQAEKFFIRNTLLAKKVLNLNLGLNQDVHIIHLAYKGYVCISTHRHMVNVN